jgi:adenine phosphoribosyltransferase
MVRVGANGEKRGAPMPLRRAAHHAAEMGAAMSQMPSQQPAVPDAQQVSWLKSFIRDVPDFPQPGILFRDITPLLEHAAALRASVEWLAHRYRGVGLDQVVGIESRGFIFGTPLAYLLGTGFVPVRKMGKLPGATVRIEYALEYGTNVLEMQVGAVKRGQRVLVVDDLLATGGTTAGTVALVEQQGGEVVSLAFLIELTALEGRQRLAGRDVYALLRY